MSLWKSLFVLSAGARLVLEVAKKADEMNRKVVVGLQRHYQASYRETIMYVTAWLATSLEAGLLERQWHLVSKTRSRHE